MKCRNCNTELRDGAHYCHNCGCPEEGVWKCGTCGTELKPGTKFCPGCGECLEKNNSVGLSLKTSGVSIKTIFGSSTILDEKLPSYRLAKSMMWRVFWCTVFVIVPVLPLIFVLPVFPKFFTLRSIINARRNSSMVNEVEDDKILFFGISSLFAAIVVAFVQIIVIMIMFAGMRFASMFRRW